ncbi:MAG TPA: phosphoribosylglycinamide formyltransferase [Pararhizobium sp.]|nr:phosphoribosylglycinamide formyltransferase [Pararhizobium sp.]
MTAVSRKRVAVLISGRGSNMAALIAAAEAPDFPAEIVAVLADKTDAAGLDVARAHGIPAIAVPRNGFPDKAAHEAAVLAELDRAAPDIICLAGYMRLLSPAFIGRYHGRIITLPPSLLPLFPGLDTHARALAAGMRIHGCSVHFVTEGMDEGPVIAQAAVPVVPGDTPGSLAERVLVAEHRLYPAALAMLAAGRVQMDENGRSTFTPTTALAADAILISAG